MKKKYRRAVYYGILAITSPIWVIPVIGGVALILCIAARDWLEAKLRVYDTDPE